MNKYFQVASSTLLLATAFASQLATIAQAQAQQPAQGQQQQTQPAAQAQRPAPRPQFQIRPIKGNLYRAGNGVWHAIFLVTDAGIILADPLNVPFATWLKEQLAQQFKVPVRYVIYSHSHFDHVEGAAVFKDTATIIAYEGVLANLDGRYPNMPGDMIDRNGNGMIDRDDIMIPTNADPGICGMSAQFFDQYDRNKDGMMTPAELQQDIVKPDIYYADHMTLTLGGKRVELFHPGKNHGNDMTAVYFPEERVVFATDMIADALVRNDIRSLPSACGALDGTPIAEWIRSYQAIEALDFDTFAGGHGEFFSKADIVKPRQFLEDLQAAVSKAIAAGQTLEQMKKSILLEQYKEWAYYDRLREKNIEAMYLNLIKFQ
jgi:glyoxylase-like metal-dependent hydrolase (beta-lactamase superfamily II)